MISCIQSSLRKVWGVRVLICDTLCALSDLLRKIRVVNNGISVFYFPYEFTGAKGIYALLVQAWLLGKIELFNCGMWGRLKSSFFRFLERLRFYITIAEEANVDVLLITDDKFEKMAEKLELGTRVVNPLRFAWEVI